ncbi:MAG: cobalamin B12-binding domain-containing protein [Acidimicrobiales bacterium]
MKLAAGGDAGRARGARGRVLVAKVGLDGHDRGVKVVGRTLRDAGYEVIYTGLQQTPAMVVATARDEDVDVIGLSLLSGAHMSLVPRVLDGLAAQDLDIPVVVGGIIPDADVARLRGLGVAAVLTPGASTRDIVDAVAGAMARQGVPE